VSITIEKVDLYRVRMPLVHEFETSSHKKSFIEHILVRATDSMGFVGWGECASPADPYFCYESTDTCWLILRRYLVPSVLGEPWDTPDEAYRIAEIKGNPFARAAIDMTCWDLYSQHLGLPLANALGGTAETIESGVSLGIEPSIDVLLKAVAGHVDEGYRRIKLKIAPGWEIEPVRQVRDAFPDIALQVDANGGFEPSPASTEVFVELDGYGLLMIEQPFEEDELLAHAALQGRLETPVCLDESISSAAAVSTALALEACRIVNIKVSRLGGLGKAREVHDLCFDAGIPVWCGGMHEFGVGRAANIAVASLPGFTYPSDISGSKKYYEHDVVVPEIVAKDGQVRVPHEVPGIGYEVHLERVEKYLVNQTSLYAKSLYASSPQPYKE
jgi:O-succinylbenzoate synthase